MQPTDQLGTIVPALCDLVDQLTPADLHRATPCDRDDMRDGETFKAPTVPPPTAAPIERLAAFRGRTANPEPHKTNHQRGENHAHHPN